MQLPFQLPLLAELHLATRRSIDYVRKRAHMRAATHAVDEAGVAATRASYS